MTNINNAPISWTTITKKVNDLIPQEINPRKITDKQMSLLKKSLQKFNLAEIPAIDFDGKILAGHQRIKALQLLGRGEEIIDVRIPNRKLTEEESKEYLIGSNKLGGDWDFDLLKSFDIPVLEFAGFDKIELTNFWNKDKQVEEDKMDIEKEIKNNKNPKTKLGDIIHLGKHRIICADSTKQENLQKLFGKDRASMIYSDPVYNIKINYNGGIGGEKNYGGNVNDDRTLNEYTKFLDDSLKAGLSVSEDNVHVFYWCDQVYIGTVQDIFKNNNIHNKRVCLWLKNSQNPVPDVAFNKCYEPCVYGIKGAPFLNNGETKYHEVMNQEFITGNEMYEAVDVWLSKRIAGQKMEHATSKPITLHEKAIKRCTKVGDIILDSFLGSGSTLLCAEQLGRVVYGCELEPVFCDLIVKRWEQMTGQKAVYEKTS